MRLNFNDERSYRLKKYEEPEFYGKYRFPFPLRDLHEIEIPYNTDADSIAERLKQYKQFKEEIDFQRVQLMKQNHGLTPENRLINHRFQQDYPKDFQPSNFLEEARVYAQDNDLGFAIDDSEEDNVEDIIGQPKFTNQPKYTEHDTKKPSTFVEEQTENLHTAHRIEGSDDEDDEDDDTAKRDQKIKLMENPSDFAYAPADPRFYRKAANPGPGKSENFIISIYKSR